MSDQLKVYMRWSKNLRGEWKAEYCYYDIPTDGHGNIQPSDETHTEWVPLPDEAFHEHANDIVINEMLAWMSNPPPGMSETPTIEPKAPEPNCWRIDVKLPSGSIQWQVVEHENHARQIAAEAKFPAEVYPLYRKA